MKRPILVMIILIPAASVVMGLATLYFAFNEPDPVVQTHQQPLGKTSWRDAPLEDQPQPRINPEDGQR